MEVIRKFETGANRDVNNDKYDYEGFNSPLVMQEFAAYMHENRFLKDGTIRDSDNWQKGFGNHEEHRDVCMESGFRHFMDWWMEHRGYDSREGVKKAICGLLFNANAYLHDILVEEIEEKQQ